MISVNFLSEEDCLTVYTQSVFFIEHCAQESSNTWNSIKMHLAKNKIKMWSFGEFIAIVTRKAPSMEHLNLNCLASFKKKSVSFGHLG